MIIMTNKEKINCKNIRAKNLEASLQIIIAIID